MRPDSWLGTLNCAVEGVLHAVKTERHVRWHAVVALAVLITAALLSVRGVEFAALCLAAALVVVAEMVNTALEGVVDLASPGLHPLARAVKDVAAGAVLVAAFAAVAVGWVVLYPRVGREGAAVLAGLDAREPVAVAAVVLAALVAVILLKALVGRGPSLREAAPSGHALVAFAIATVLTLRTEDVAVGFLSGVLALMVSHSRLLHREQTAWSVAAGAAVGVALAATLYWVVR